MGEQKILSATNCNEVQSALICLRLDFGLRLAEVHNFET